VVWGGRGSVERLWGGKVKKGEKVEKDIKKGGAKNELKLINQEKRRRKGTDSGKKKKEL